MIKFSREANPTSFIQPSAKQTTVSRNSQFSINSNDYGESSNFSNNLKEGRTTVYSRNVKLFPNQGSDKSRSVISQNKQEAKQNRSPKDSKKRADNGKSSKSQDNIKTPEQRNRKDEMLCDKEDSEEFSIDTFLDRKWERKRTHHLSKLPFLFIKKAI